MSLAVLLVLVAVSAGVTIIADRRGRFGLVYIFKPLATVLVIVLAVVRARPGDRSYAPFILAGLAASLAGDILMMLRRKRFSAGLGAFLLGHLLYFAAMVSRVSRPLSLGVLLPYVLYFGFVTGALWGRLGRMKFPVLAYMLVIMAMAAAAAQAHSGTPSSLTLGALWGSILFIVSDSVLAANRFVRPFPSAQVLILGTYYAAQTLIALSV